MYKSCSLGGPLGPIVYNGLNCDMEPPVESCDDSNSRRSRTLRTNHLSRSKQRPPHWFVYKFQSIKLLRSSSLIRILKIITNMNRNLSKMEFPFKNSTSSQLGLVSDPENPEKKRKYRSIGDSSH